MTKVNKQSKNWLFQNKFLVLRRKKHEQGFLLVFLFFSFASFTQNLVPNGSFNLHNPCPDNNSQLNRAIPWFSPTGTTTDLFDSCALNNSTANVPYIAGVTGPTVNSLHGSGMIGMYQYTPGNREYAQVKLTHTLTSALCYYAEFYIKR